MSIKFSSQGQGLVETLIAVSVAIIVVTSLISLAVFTLRNSRQSSYTAQATQLAQNQLELLRSYRDKDSTTWATFYDLYSSGGINCNGTLPTTCGQSDPANKCAFAVTAAPGDAPTAGSQVKDTIFTYYFTVTCGGSSCTDSGTAVLRGNAYVKWTVGGRTQCAYNYTDFTNWRSK